MMTLKEKVKDAIDCLRSCIVDENRKDEEPFLSDFERGAILGRIDGYEKAIELLQYILEVEENV